MRNHLGAWLCAFVMLGAGAHEAHPAHETPAPHAAPNVRIAQTSPTVASTASAVSGHAGHGAHTPRPQLGTGVAFAPDGRLWLVGVNAQGALFVQTAPANDLKQWDAPRVLDTQDDTISADGENRPKLAFGPQGWAVISYTQPLPKVEAGQIRMLRSTDGGQTFSAPFTVHADRQEITHRFEAIGFDAQGALHTVWIDSRDQEQAVTAGSATEVATVVGTGAPAGVIPGSASSYRGFAVYRNVSRDGGASFGPDLRVADHSCECCRLALAVGSDGQARALWRHVFEPNVRDHAFAVLNAGPATGGAQVAAVSQAASTVVRATYDDWRIDACPHNGPALAAASDGGFHAVWFGMRQQGAHSVAAVRYARLKADGSPVRASVQALPDVRAEHADVLAAGAHVAVVWRSVDGARSRLVAWLSRDNGRTFRQQALGEVSGPNDFPRLVRLGERIVAVWRNPQEVKTHELPF